MRTIRQNVFETNSSSCHVVTILSDKEYNDIVDGKAFLTYDGEVEVISETAVNDYLTRLVNNAISGVDHAESQIKKLSPLLEQDTGDWSSDQKRAIAYNYKGLTGTQLKTQLKETLDKYAMQSKSNAIRAEEYKKYNAKKITEIIFEIAQYLEEIKENDLSYEDFSNRTSLKCTEDEYDIAYDYISDYDNINTFGSGYDDNDECSRTIDGVTVHVLSYSGYNG